MNTELRRELESLLSALCDGTLTDAEHARLEQLLGADAACRHYYLEYVDMHARLLAHPRFAAAATPPPSMAKLAAETLEAPAVATESRGAIVARPGRSGSVLRYGAVAAATLAASLLVHFVWWHPQPADDNRDHSVPQVAAPAAAPAAEPVATLMQSENCAWHGLREPLRDGVRLPPGKLLLDKGVARIRFDTGSELLLQGPAELRLDGPDTATLLRGRLVFTSDVMAGPFAVHTPTATLVDLGTECGVTVGEGGEEVHVFEGNVQRVPRSDAVPADPQYLAAGEACRSVRNSFRSQPTKCDPARFVHRLAAPPAPDAAVGLLAYEGFDYKSPSALATGKANGGLGWAGPWSVTVAKPLEWGDKKRLPLNVAEGLTRPDARSPGVGGRFDHAGFGVYYRPLKTPLRLDSDGVYYLSCLFRRFGPVGHPQNTIALMLRPNERNVALDGNRGKWKDGAHHHHGHDATPNLANRLMIGVGGCNQVFTRVGTQCARTSLPMSGVPYLLVAKVVASRVSYDQVFVRVYAPREEVGTEEPASWTVVSPALHSNLVFQALGVHVNSKNRQMIDEIRVGTTWSSVTGPWLRAPGAPALKAGAVVPNGKR